jgi:tetratricopeptide (TPR) repeat protein
MAEAREALEGHYVTDGYAARAAGRRDEAAAQFRKAVDVNPDGRAGRLELGQELETRGDLAGAAAEYAAVTRSHPDEALAHQRLGTVAERQGDHERAAREFAEVVRLTPLDPEAHRGLATAYQALGRKDEALAAAHEAMRSYMRKGLEDKALEMQGVERKLVSSGAQYRPTPRASVRHAPRDDD